MSKFDYVIELCWEKTKELRKEIFFIYEKEAGNLGRDLRITAEDCKEWVQKLQKQIAELNAAIKILDQIKKED